MDKMVRQAKEEGSISSIFASLNGKAVEPLPQKFSDLKKTIWNDGLTQTWSEVLKELDLATQEIIDQTKKGVDIIPRVSYQELEAGLSGEMVSKIKKAGTVVVTGAVPVEEALGWKKSIQEHVKNNKPLVKGFPQHDIQVYELYHTKAQISARTNPALLQTQKSLLSLWHAPESLSSEIDLATPVSYFDRVRIRTPGDRSFALGPHDDLGTVERWEDPAFRKVYAAILAGGDQWRKHDPFDAEPRLTKKQQLYATRTECSVFRPFQGWTSLSTTSAGEGTLQVFPRLALASAYTILRPFFRPRAGADPASYNGDDWEPDLDGTSFPGSVPGNTQEYNHLTHPHMRLNQTMLSIRNLQPGDQVFWHCDVIHAVESVHGGTGDASVLYIPAIPLTPHNADYLRDQRVAFQQGIPPPDFPGGEGESKFVGRAGEADVISQAAKTVLGLSPFGVSGGLNAALAGRVNEILGY